MDKPIKTFIFCNPLNKDIVTSGYNLKSEIKKLKEKYKFETFMPIHIFVSIDNQKEPIFIWASNLHKIRHWKIKYKIWRKVKC